MRHPAMDAPDERVGEADQAVDDACLHHQFAGQHEQRDRHQRKGVHREHHALRQHDQVEPVEVERHDGAEPDREGQRRADDREHGKDGDGHALIPVPPSRRRAPDVRGPPSAKSDRCNAAWAAQMQTGT